MPDTKDKPRNPNTSSDRDRTGAREQHQDDSDQTGGQRSPEGQPERGAERRPDSNEPTTDRSSTE